MVEPVCSAPSTSQVEVVKFPLMCVGMFGSQYHLSMPRAAPENWPLSQYFVTCVCGLNWLNATFKSNDCILGSTTQQRSSGTPTLRSRATISVKAPSTAVLVTGWAETGPPAKYTDLYTSAPAMTSDLFASAMPALLVSFCASSTSSALSALDQPMPTWN